MTETDETAPQLLDHLHSDITVAAGPLPISDETRARLRELQRSINAARASSIAQVKRYNNMLIGAVILLTICSIALPFVIPYTSVDLGVLRAVPLGSPPNVTPRSLASVDIATLEVWGAVGGLVGLIVSLRKLVSTRAPVRLQAAQLVLKLPAGAITSVFGLMIFQAAIMPTLASATLSQLAAYALIFGFAQEAVTSMVDTQANKLLERSKSTDEAVGET
jgi:hypothetical protein